MTNLTPDQVERIRIERAGDEMLAVVNRYARRLVDLSQDNPYNSSIRDKLVSCKGVVGLLADVLAVDELASRVDRIERRIGASVTGPTK